MQTRLRMTMGGVHARAFPSADERIGDVLAFLRAILLETSPKRCVLGVERVFHLE